jgi:hypothetical protein
MHGIFMWVVPALSNEPLRLTPYYASSQSQGAKVKKNRLIMQLRSQLTSCSRELKSDRFMNLA